MRGLTVIHGISAGGDDTRRGYSVELVEALTDWGCAFEGPYWQPDVVEVYWASLAQRLAGILGHAGVVGDYLSDVDVYARDQRGLIRDHVAAQLDAAGPNRVVLAHSLGSVIALDLLLEGRLNAAALITVGSPLGVDLSRELAIPGVGFLDRERRARTAPIALPLGWRWLNAGDPQDVVVCGLGVGCVPDLSALEGYRRLGVEQLPDLDTGGLWSSHNGYWTDPVVVSSVFQLMTEG